MKPKPQRQVDVGLLPAQYQFVFSNAKFPAFVGGVGSGKTYAGAWRLVKKLLEKPGITCAYYGADYRMLTDRPRIEITEALYTAEIDHTYRKGPSIFDCGPYGEIRLLSFGDVGSIRSIQLAHAVVDELERHRIEDARARWQQIVLRMRGSAEATLGVVTTPDQGTSGFMYETWGQPRPDHETIHASTYDNYHIPDLEGYIRGIKAQHDDRMAELYLNGAFVPIGDGYVYYAYRDNPEACHRTRPDALPSTLYIGLDFNVGACFASVATYQNQTLHIVDEFLSRDTWEFVERAKSRYPDKALIVCPDASGGARSTSSSATDHQIIQGAGFHLSAPVGNPYVQDRVLSVNGAFARKKLTIDQNTCPLLHRALVDHSYKDGEPEKFNEHPIHAGSIDDRTDALGYLVHQTIPVTRPDWNRGFSPAM